MNIAIRKPRTVKTALRRARALIEDEAAWIKGDYHEVINGRECFCAFGAVGRAALHDPEPDAFYPEGSLAGRTERVLIAALPSGFTTIEAFNDNDDVTHRDILALFDRAIAVAR